MWIQLSSNTIDHDLLADWPIPGFRFKADYMTVSHINVQFTYMTEFGSLCVFGYRI